MAVTVVADETAVLQFTGEAFAPLVRRRGVTGRAEDDDRRRPGRLHLVRSARGLDRPVGAHRAGPRHLPAPRRRLLRERLRVLLVLGHAAGRRRAIEARHGVEHLHHVALVRAVVVALGVALARAEQLRAVTTECAAHRLRQLTPLRLVVERRGDSVDRPALRQGTEALVAARLDGFGVEAGEPGLQLLLRGRGVGPERALAARDAIGEVGVERLLEAGRLPLVDLLHRQIGRQDAVEHHAPDVLREQVGVRRAEHRAVRLAEEVQLLLAESRTQDVHVLRDLFGADVAEQRAGVLLARVGELLVAGQQRVLLALVVG